MRHLGDRPHPVVASAARELLNKSENERSGVLSTAMSFLGLYRDPVVAKVTSRCDWRIGDLVRGERPATLYLVVFPSDISRTKPLVREHQPIISRDVWDKVHAILRDSPRLRAARTRAQTPALLKGLIFGPTGCAMSPTHTRKGGRLYRYYVSQSVLKRGPGACPIGRVPAAEIESAVVDQLRGLAAPEIIVGTWRAARPKIEGIAEEEVREALERLDPLWNELFPAEQARIVQLLVERVDVRPDRVDIRLRTEGLANLVADLSAVRPESRRAA